MNKVLLIDGNSIFFRAYYGSAYGRDGVLKTSKGVPVNAVLTFNNMLNKYLTLVMPSHVFVAFDTGKPTFRHKIMKSYKAGRSKVPDDMKPQWKILKEMLDHMQIKHGEVEAIEADDIIGTLSYKWSIDNEVLILSSDKDLYQLVNNNTSIISPQNGQKDDKVIDDNNFHEITSIYPNQVVDYKGIVGDPSDNLPGVFGIGDKGAIKLLSEHKTLENVYANVNDLPPKMQEKLLKSKEMAFLSKKMAEILLNADVQVDLNNIIFNNEVSEKLINFYKKYELFSLVRRYEGKISSKKTEYINLDL